MIEMTPGRVSPWPSWVDYGPKFPDEGGEYRVQEQVAKYKSSGRISKG